MADIFISYASLDRPTARRLAQVLEACGWSVWWDYRGLRGGQPFEGVIEQAISTARVVIVVWSQNSIQSDWVRAEAALALDEKKLVPLRIDKTVLPLRYRNIHTIDLSSWTGEREAEPFERLLETLSDYLGSPKKAEQPERRSEPPSQAEPADVAARPPSVPGRKHLGKYLAAILATGGVLLGVVMLMGRQEVLPPEPPTEATVCESPASTEDVGADMQAAYERGYYKMKLILTRPDADQGDAVAQFNLGVMYAQGRGVPQDDAEAVRWYRKAADQGHPTAQNNLGMMYQEGHGVPRDDAEAVRWYRKAAERGHAIAQANLDRLSAKGSR
jgi:hypothetical protein